MDELIFNVDKIVKEAILLQCDGTALREGFDRVRLPELFGKDVEEMASEISEYVSKELIKLGYHRAN